MSIIEKQSQIPDMYEIRHKHDTIDHEDFAYDYTNNLYKKSLSSFLLMNPKMKEFTDSLSNIITVMIDSTQGLKNMFFYSHSKFYNKNGR